MNLKSILNYLVLDNIIPKISFRFYKNKQEPNLANKIDPYNFKMNTHAQVIMKFLVHSIKRFNTLLVENIRVETEIVYLVLVNMILM